VPSEQREEARGQGCDEEAATGATVTARSTKEGAGRATDGGNEAPFSPEHEEGLDGDGEEAVTSNLAPELGVAAAAWRS
jgi:hypothetical protein